MVDDFLTAKEVSKLDYVVDVVTIFDIVRLVDHPDIVKDIVFTNHKLQQNYTNWPDIRLVWLLRVMQYWFERHVGLCTYFVSAYYLQTIWQTFVYLEVLFNFCYIFALLFHFVEFLFKGRLEFRIDLCQSKIDYHASSCIRIVEEVTRFDISMIDAQLSKISQANEQFIDIMLDFVNREGVEESLSLKNIYDKGFEFEILKNYVSYVVMNKEVH